MTTEKMERIHKLIEVGTKLALDADEMQRRLDRHYNRLSSVLTEVVNLRDGDKDPDEAVVHVRQLLAALYVDTVEEGLQKLYKLGSLGLV
jgi:hypothetical protein